MTELTDRTIAQRLADFIAGFDLAAAPVPVIDRARGAFIDTVGVILAGSRQEVAHIVLDLVRDEGTVPAASIVGQSVRASVQAAAFANGVAGHAMDYDLTYIVQQALAPIIPAILPLAEATGATPRECMAAFIVGAEVVSHFLRANYKVAVDGGWHTVGMVGVLGAAAASARLLNVPHGRLPAVMGIAASLASGLTSNFGSMTKPLHAGNAARNGVIAAQLAGRGFTANPDAFERRGGYFFTFGRGLEVTLDPFQDLGTRYDLAEMGYKLKAYPCGGLTHSSIEAALALRERVGSRVADIANIHCSVTRNAAQRAGTQYPATVEAAKFSLAYVVSYALLHGAPKIAAFTDAALSDDRLRMLVKTVTASVEPAFGIGIEDSPALVRITLKDGQVFEQRVDYVTGSTRRPMTGAEIEAKFSDCATQAVSAETAEAILAILHRLPDGGSLNDLWPLLRTA